MSELAQALEGYSTAWFGPEWGPAMFVTVK